MRDFSLSFLSIIPVGLTLSHPHTLFPHSPSVCSLGSGGIPALLVGDIGPRTLPWRAQLF